MEDLTIRSRTSLQLVKIRPSRKFHGMCMGRTFPKENLSRIDLANEEWCKDLIRRMVQQRMDGDDSK